MVVLTVSTAAAGISPVNLVETNRCRRCDHIARGLGFSVGVGHQRHQCGRDQTFREGLHLMVQSAVVGSKAWLGRAVCISIALDLSHQIALPVQRHARSFVSKDANEKLQSNVNFLQRLVTCARRPTKAECSRHRDRRAQRRRDPPAKDRGATSARGRGAIATRDPHSAEVP